MDKRSDSLTIWFRLVAFCGIASAAVGAVIVSAPVQELEQPFLSSVVKTAVPAWTQGQVLVHRHLYVAAIDKERKQPAWVAYTVKRQDWDTDRVLERNFNTPSELRDFCLEQSDYEGSGYDLGHLYGLQFVSANDYAAEVNQLCAIAAQAAALNRGPWLKVEDKIKQFSESSEVHVVAGLAWKTPIPPLPGADESHAIASHCWILFTVRSTGATVAYIFPQTVKLEDDPQKYAVTPDKLKEFVSPIWWRPMK